MLDGSSTKGTKWKQIVDDLTLQIRSGQLAAGTRVPNEVEVAAQYKVSRPTAHRALRELAALKLIGRKRRAGSVVLESSKEQRHIVALIVDRSASAFDFPQADFISGIQEALGSEYGLALYDSADSWQQELSHLRRAARSCDGALLVPLGDHHSKKTLESLRAESFPLVIVDRLLETLALPTIVPDDQDSTRHAVEFLISLGHKKLAFVSFDKPENSSVKLRHQAFVKAIEAAGLPLIERFLPRELELNDARRQAAIDDMLFSLAKGSGVTAAFCVQDSLMLGILQACDSHGIPTPSDFEVSGFNEWPPMLLGRPWDVHRIVRRKREIGRLAAQNILAQIAGKPVDPVTYVTSQLIPVEPGPAQPGAAAMSAWVESASKRITSL